jgi:hypothetical protein
MRRCGDLYLLTSVGKEELNSGRPPVIAQAAKNENLRKQAIMALIFLQCPRKLVRLYSPRDDLVISSNIEDHFVSGS